MKRVISLLLCLVMCVTIFSATAAQAFAADKADGIFKIEKTDFENDKITYTISLKANQTKISGAILKFKFDSTVLNITSDSGAIGSLNSQNEFAANVTGYYETGFVYDDENTYAIAYMNPNGFNIGNKDKEFIKIVFEAVGESRPVTAVEFYCDEFITDDGDDTNDIRKADGSQKIFSHEFFTLNPAKNLEVASCEAGLKFSWTSAAGAEKYNIYRREVSNDDGSLSDWAKLTEVPAGTTEYIDESIVKGVEYYYSVESANEFGVREYDKTGLPGFFFGTITEIAVSPTERGAMVSWGALNGAESYSVYRNEDLETDANGKLIWKKVGETNGETYCEDEPLTSGVQYYYTVKAHKGAYVAESSVDPATLIFIANASIVGCKLNYADIVINWSFVPLAVSYEVYRKAPGESEYTLVGTTTENIYTDTDVEDKATYSYQVRSVAENGDKSVLGTTGYDVTKLPLTTEVVAALGEDHITVSWMATDLAEQYIIYRKTTTGTWMRITSVPAAQTKFDDTVVDSGVTYIYAIVSKANNLETELSVVSNSVYFLSAPEVVGVFNGSNGMEFKFKKVEGAEKYNIYRREANGQFGAPVGTIAQDTLKEYKYVDADALSGVQYVYGVQSVYGDIKSAITESDLACCLDEPDVELNAAYGGVEVSWNAVRGAEEYRVFYSTTRKAEDLKLVATVKDTSYIHEAATSGRNNYYAVMAVCGDTVSTVTQQYIYYLSVPEILEIKSYKTYLTLKWQDVLGADEYIVYRKESGKTQWEKVKATLEYEEIKEGDNKITYITAKDSSVVAGKKYVYTIVSGDGEDYSARYEKGWTVTFLKNPTIKSVENAYGGPKITWSAAAGATEYYIYRKTKSSSWTKVGSTKSTSYTDKSAKSDTKYYYAVKSVDGDSASYHSTSHFNDIAKTVNYLAAPVVKAENTTSTSIKVSWGKVSGAQKYYVYRKAGSATKWTKVKTTTSTSYTDTNVKNGTTYKYMVKAVDGTIVSGYNTSGTSIKRLAAPTPKSVASSKSGVTFKWAKVTGASGYVVYRKEGSGSYKELATVKGSTKVSYLDKTAKKGKTYTYIVKAYSGSSQSANKTGLKIKDKY